MRIAITGGGTGGHLAVAKALMEEFDKRGIKPLYIGSERGQEREWFKEERGFSKKIFLPSQTVVDKKGTAKLASLISTAKLTKKALKILRENEIETLLSVGGYSAAPASFAAILAGIDLYVHEQNSVYGRLNALLKPFAKRVFNSFMEPYDPYPIRDIFFETSRIRTEIKRVIFLGGSQGARQINDCALKLASKLQKMGIEILHQTGYKDYERVKLEYEKLNIKAHIFPFCSQIEKKLALADIAVSRAGAGTAWELAANALPAIFIPYPYAARNHQELNARFFAERGAAIIMKNCDEGAFLDIMERSPTEMSKRLASIAKKGGAGFIAERILKKE